MADIKFRGWGQKGQLPLDPGAILCHSKIESFVQKNVCFQWVVVWMRQRMGHVCSDCSGTDTFQSGIAFSGE